MLGVLFCGWQDGEILLSCYQKRWKLLTAFWVATAGFSVSGSISPWRVVFYYWWQAGEICDGYCDICSGFGELAQQHVLWICGWRWMYHFLGSCKILSGTWLQGSCAEHVETNGCDAQFVQVPQLHRICVKGYELCVTALGFPSGRSHLTCCNNLQNGCQVMLEDQMLFSCKVSW